MLKSELARRSFAGLWFAAAAAIPIGLYFLILPLSSGTFYQVITTVVPILSAGVGGLWLGAGILDEKKTKSPLGAIGRGLAIAALSYLILFIVEIIAGVIYNRNRDSHDIFRLIDVVTMMFLYGLLIIGWLVAAVGAAAGGLLYLFSSKKINEENL